MNSIIIQTKIDILKYGVNFKPYDMFTNYENIEKYKTTKIKVKPVRKDNEVYDMSTDYNILPSEIIISNNLLKFKEPNDIYSLGSLIY